MAVAIDYYFTAQSPWTYLGHDRFVRMAREAGAQVHVRPADYGKVFPVSGGLPLPKRAPQRQAYRLVELRRFSQFLDIPLNVNPKHFPVGADDANRLITAVERADGADAALQLCGSVFAAVWRQERDIASALVLGELLAECGLPAARLEQSRDAAVQQTYEANTQAAIDAGVFGAPSYVTGGEIFWGQDRLDFLERKLRSIN
jgi:2-hydroxychromene-2-carboxylate isomerase